MGAPRPECDHGVMQSQTEGAQRAARSKAHGPSEAQASWPGSLATLLLVVSCGADHAQTVAVDPIDAVLPPYDPASPCVELTEGVLARAWKATTFEQGRYASTYATSSALYGARATRLYTSSSTRVTMRLELPDGEWDVARYDAIWISARGTNTNAGGWQNRAPEIALIDARARRRTYRPTTAVASTDGTWRTFAIPLNGDGQWSAVGATVDLSRVVAVELAADTYGAGFRLDVDAFFFAGMDGTCDAAPVVRPRCDEITEGYSTASWRASVSDGAAATVSILGRTQAIDGGQAVRLDTRSGFLVTLRKTFDRPIDTSGRPLLIASIRAFNGNPHGWQIATPEVILEDVAGGRARYRSATPFAPIDGLDWREVRVPLAGGPEWTIAGTVDRSRIAAIEILADTWGAGFTLDLDRMYFSPSDPLCGRTPGGYDVWPNPVSRANGDRWLVEHRSEIRRLEPKVLVLNFVNPSDPSAVAALVDATIAGYREASRPRGYETASEPQLSYRLARPIVDLRDPTPPSGWTFENSSIMPRRDPSEPGAWRFDYAELFSARFAASYGFADPSVPSGYEDLCRLVEDGDVHEVWLVVSGESPADPVTLAESIEHKQRYDAYGNRITGAFDGCGNGCFDPDVPRCARSLRFVSINYRRGPGCALHSLGHLIESQAPRGVLPGAEEWFVKFARFDLDTVDRLPFSTLYGQACSGPPPEPDWGPGCIEHPTPESARFTYDQIHTRSPWDPACGNVHFPPNARSHYDYVNPGAVLSTCTGFGRGGAPSLVASDRWAAYEAATPDCGGGFLVWWYQNMPGHGSGHAYLDGRPMPSIWPSLFF
jgi:hypothetical protein